LYDLVAIQIVLFISYKKYKEGDKSAKWVLIGYLVLNVFFGILYLERLNIIASNVFTVYALNLGLIIKFIFLSVGIVEGIRDTYKKKDEIQKQVIDQLDEIKNLSEKVNRELEEKVAQRTGELKQKNKEIFASVRYAKNIQEALLPREENFNSVKEYFILYKPKDIISGDFYWIYTIDEDRYLIAAVDCTGHGVPGALISMIGINLLNAIVAKKITNPGEILTNLNDEIQINLKQYATKNQDGMDMAICLVDRKAKEITYSGARNPLVYIKNNEIHKIKATRKSIGGYGAIEKIIFENHTITFENEEIYFYLFSDGFQDQFSHDGKRKFSSKRLMQKLLEYHKLPMKEQRLLLLQDFDQWKGAEMQIDDILILGVKE